MLRNYNLIPQIGKLMLFSRLVCALWQSYQLVIVFLLVIIRRCATDPPLLLLKVLYYSGCAAVFCEQLQLL